MQAEEAQLTNHFLLAMPHIEGGGFAGSLTYICDHSENGAMGIVVNRPMNLSLGEIFEQMDLGNQRCTEPVYAGGPVQVERGFVLHGPDCEWQSTLKVAEGIYLTTSRDVLCALAEEEGPEHYLVALGYAGWGPGQLEEELVNNVWLTCDASDEILFEVPFHKRLQAAAHSLGIDMSQLTPSAGHA